MIFGVYISRWKKADGTIDNGPEKLMFEIPSNPEDGFPIDNPSVKGSEDSADSFDFTLSPASPYYDSLVEMKTLFRVVYGGETIFFGRVLTVNGSSVIQTKSVHCEGAMAFLNDSFYPGLADKDRSEIDWSTYVDRIIANHNSYIADDPYKKFSKGLVSFTPTDKNKKFEPSGWSQTSSLFSSLKDEFGGHMLMRYSDGGLYLDWYKYTKRDRGTTHRPEVRVTKNILDISTNMDVDSLFTRVIPIGGTKNEGDRVYIDGYKYTDKNGAQHTHDAKYFPVTLIPSLYTDQELSDDYHSVDDYTNAEGKYGVIYRTVQFSDAETQEELWNECKKWIKNSYYGAVTSFDIKAVDMYVTDNTLPLIALGDTVDVYFRAPENGVMGWQYRKRVCKSVKYELFHPENNSYTFSVPSDLLKTTQSEQKKKAKTASAASSQKSEKKSDPDYNLTFKKIADIIRKDKAVGDGYGGDAAADSFLANGELTGNVKCYDADIHYDPGGHPEIIFTASLVGWISLSGKSTKYIAFNSAHGLFAYLDDNAPELTYQSSKKFAIIAKNANIAKGSTHWYIKKSGYSYNTVGGSMVSALSAGASGLFGGLFGLPNDGGTGDTTNFLQFFGEDGTITSGSVDSLGSLLENTFAVDGEDGIIKTIKGLFGGDAANGGDATISLDGLTETLTQFTLSGGPLGNAIKKGLELVGGGKISLFDTGASGEEDVKTVEVTGEDDGKMNVGVKNSQGGWRITLNEEVTYDDEDGVRHTLQPGFIICEDMKIDGLKTVPSFATKFAVIDTLVANKVEANQIKAQLAYIDKIRTSTIYADTVVSAGSSYFTNSSITNAYIKNPYSYYNFNGQQYQYNLGDCFSDWIGIEEGTGDNAGKFRIGITKANRTGTVYSNFFDIAATQFYKDAVAASQNTGWNAARNIVNASLPKSSTEQAAVNTNWIMKLPNTGYNSGSSDLPVSVSDITDYSWQGVNWKVLNVKIGSYIAYRKAVNLQNYGKVTPTTSDNAISPGSGYVGIGSLTVAGDANLTAGNIKSGVSIFGVEGTYSGGGGSIAPNRIQIHNYEHTYTPKTGDTPAPTLASTIKRAISNRGGLGTIASFSVYISGTDPLVEKTYYLDFRTDT